MTMRHSNDNVKTYIISIYQRYEINFCQTGFTRYRQYLKMMKNRTENEMGTEKFENEERLSTVSMILA